MYLRIAIKDGTADNSDYNKVGKECIFCIRAKKDGGTTWSEKVRKCHIKAGMMFMCNEDAIRGDVLRVEPISPYIKVDACPFL